MINLLISASHTPDRIHPLSMAPITHSSRSPFSAIGLWSFSLKSQSCSVDHGQIARRWCWGREMTGISGWRPFYTLSKTLPSYSPCRYISSSHWEIQPLAKMLIRSNQRRHHSNRDLYHHTYLFRISGLRLCVSEYINFLFSDGTDSLWYLSKTFIHVDSFASLMPME